MIPKSHLSFEPVTLDFTKNEPLWVLGGPNGVGKSAVFDAMTFALFGQHRGGKQRVDELIRHGATGFRIVFEFTFDGVDYRITRSYSGSHRFRVAVSLALAIGRFAAGKRRPIEAVIIDEGFGSLDEDGLRAMAENLQELRRTQALKRIILVSHQKDFTSQFTAGYRLSPGPNGTTAERI